MKVYNEDTDTIKKKYIFQLVDHKSKFRVAEVISQKKPEYIIPILHRFFGIIGPPASLQCDCGREFINNQFGELLTLWGITLVTSAPRHPSTNGTVERANGVLKRAIRSWKRSNPEDNWEDFLPLIVHQLNAKYHESLGSSPYEYAFVIKPWIERRLVQNILHLNTLGNDSFNDNSTLNNSEVKKDDVVVDNFVDNINIEEISVNTAASTIHIPSPVFAPLYPENDDELDDDCLYESKFDDENNMHAQRPIITDLTSEIATVPPSTNHALSSILSIPNAPDIPSDDCSIVEKNPSSNLPTIHQQESLSIVSLNSSIIVDVRSAGNRIQADETYRRQMATQAKSYNKHVVPKSFVSGQLVGVVIPPRLRNRFPTAQRISNVIGKIYELVRRSENDIPKYKIRVEQYIFKEKFDAHHIVQLRGGEDTFPKEFAWKIDQQTISQLIDINFHLYVELLIKRPASKSSSIINLTNTTSVHIGKYINDEAKCVCVACSTEILLICAQSCSNCKFPMHIEEDKCVGGKHFIHDKVKKRVYCNIYCANVANFFPRIHEDEENEAPKAKRQRLNVPAAAFSANSTSSAVISSNPQHTITKNSFYEIPVQEYIEIDQFIATYVEKNRLVSKVRWTQNRISELQQAIEAWKYPLRDTINAFTKKINIYIIKKKSSDHQQPISSSIPAPTNDDTRCCVCNGVMDANMWHRCHICKRRMHGIVMCDQSNLIFMDADDNMHCHNCRNQ
jgi:hypothetical protein